ncbi:hypothetical protein [Bacillus solimangrovi]|uniref:Uncharacterized protein n=1 Tax=Bacillus solimangrovi TaxID=1305675 RepID=A0A1E5LID4_9BACI|nr:hypothetical protein [Bacillus solimangrovi]OEH93840.1 hypothetical protein BFG57_11000 [Bacillus solimangrovi]
MRNLLNFLWVYFDLFLIIVAIGLGTLLISTVIKNIKTLSIVMTILVIGTFIAVAQTDYTTFPKLYEERLNEGTIVKSITIEINDLSSNMPETIASVEIEDEAIIKSILEDFSSMKLKKDRNIGGMFREYMIRILVENEVGEKHNIISTINFDLDNNYLDIYKITSESNHLETIESLIDSEEVEWKFFAEE